MFQAIIAGFIGSISALRHTSNGKAVCNLSVAQSHKGGIRWHRVVVWGKTAEACVAHLTKGCYVVVESDQAVAKTYTGSDGNQRCSVEYWANRVNFGGRGKNSAPSVSPSDSAPSVDDNDPMPF